MSGWIVCVCPFQLYSQVGQNSRARQWSEYWYQLKGDIPRGWPVVSVRPARGHLKCSAPFTSSAVMARRFEEVTLKSWFANRKLSSWTQSWLSVHLNCGRATFLPDHAAF